MKTVKFMWVGEFEVDYENTKNRRPEVVANLQNRGLFLKTGLSLNNGFTHRLFNLWQSYGSYDNKNTLDYPIYWYEEIREGFEPPDDSRILIPAYEV